MTTLTNKALAGPAPEAADSALDTVRLALQNGAFGTARLRFLKLAESGQLFLLEDIPLKDAVRLASGLPPYTLARLYERLPRKLGRTIVQALPDGKRQGVLVILDHRRRT